MVLLGDMRGGYICTEMSLSKRLKCLKVRWREKLGTNGIGKVTQLHIVKSIFADWLCQISNGRCRIANVFWIWNKKSTLSRQDRRWSWANVFWSWNKIKLSNCKQEMQESKGILELKENPLCPKTAAAVEAAATVCRFFDLTTSWEQKDPKG